MRRGRRFGVLNFCLRLCVGGKRSSGERKLGELGNCWRAASYQRPGDRESTEHAHVNRSQTAQSLPRLAYEGMGSNEVGTRRSYLLITPQVLVSYTQ